MFMDVTSRRTHRCVAKTSVAERSVMTATRRGRSTGGYLEPIAAKGGAEVRKRAPRTLHGATPGDVRIDVALTDVVHDSAGCLAAYCLAVPAMPLNLDNDP